MKFLILNADYTEFLDLFYFQHPNLEKQPYAEQIRIRADSLFGVADFYSSNLQKLGHEAWDIRANNESIQRMWAKEHGAPVSPMHSWQLTLRRGIVPWIRRVKNQQWLYEILATQIKFYKPDILLNQAMESVGGQFLQEIKPNIRLLIGQIAAPLSHDEDLHCYDLIISSLDNFVEYFRKQGIPSERLHLGFDLKVLERLGKPSDKSIPVSFVGGLSRLHTERVNLLEQLCRQVDLQIWGTAIQDVPAHSHLHRCYQGAAWG